MLTTDFVNYAQCQSAFFCFIFVSVSSYRSKSAFIEIVFKALIIVIACNYFNYFNFCLHNSENIKFGSW